MPTSHPGMSSQCQDGAAAPSTPFCLQGQTQELVRQVFRQHCVNEEPTVQTTATIVFLPVQPEAQHVQQVLLQLCNSGHLPERTGSENRLQSVAVPQHLQGLGNVLHPALFAS